MPRRQVTYESGMGWDFWNMVSTIGAVILGAAMLLFAHNFLRSLRKGEIAGDDPWDGRTLEWSISSPPPEYNFATIPTVHGRDAFWEEKQRRTTHVPAGGSGEEEPKLGEAHHGIHMPSPSYLPIVAAMGLGIAGYGLIYHFAVAAVGAGIALVGIYAWAMEPVTEPGQHQNDQEGD